MKLVRVSSADGPWPSQLLDPQPYLDKLPELEAGLPEGARSFATDVDHYDFASARCVKDLRFAGISLGEAGHGRLTAELRFAPNTFKHHAGLVLTYDDVVGLDLDAGPAGGPRIWPDTPRLGDVQLDEVMPHVHGCTHEIKLTGGSILVTAGDLHAEWG
ncbi:hypothetical protein [Nucisporomicrobium flavum]|uniref:hypothetical protein n=1 Tax=Nucisporomicrobium flavum TaxID=2785915 RepID=UPI0018F4EB0F|nr:hypothetical protein [Nucisporomicrobium flavum]